MRLSRRAFVATAASAAALRALPRAARADDAPNPPAVARSVVTRDSVTVASGATIAYNATASTLVLRDDHDAPTASIFSVAYTTGDRARPVTFCSNGGPGSSSVWLHVGAFGPRRIVTSTATFAPPAPYRLENNAQTLLDQTDLVFVDPVGTGYSTLAGKATSGDFWGVDQDIAAFVQFIRRWLVENGRSDAPVFLAGESYATLRNAGLAKSLHDQGIAVSGVVSISTILDFADDFADDGPSGTLVDAFAIPTEAAVAWYHKRAGAQAPDLETAIERAAAFTRETYLPALLSPAPLADAERAQIADRLHDLIGLDPAYVLRADLRVAKERFESELLRAQGRVIGRFDGRFAGAAIDRNGSDPDYDPSYEAVAPAFTAVFSAYASSALRWKADRLYRVLPGEISGAWNYRRGGFTGKILAPSTIGDLREAMHTNPSLRVFLAAGSYDLATPFYGAELELADVAREAGVAARVTTRRYPSGHMIYLNPDALVSLRADLATFFRASPART
jgi:carboxypeptidase C (cathepsin A)